MHKSPATGRRYEGRSWVGAVPFAPVAYSSTNPTLPEVQIFSVLRCHRPPRLVRTRQGAPMPTDRTQRHNDDGWIQKTASRDESIPWSGIIKCSTVLVNDANFRKASCPEMSETALEKPDRFAAGSGIEALLVPPVRDVDDMHRAIALAADEQFVAAEGKVHRLIADRDRGLRAE